MSERFTKEENNLYDEIFNEDRQAEQNAIDELIIERDDYKDKYLYALAENENIKKRFATERNFLIENGKTSVLKEIINLVDDFERGIQLHKDIKDINSLKEGIELLYRKFRASLQSFDVKQIDISENEIFNPDIHEAMSVIPVTEETADKVNTIASVTRNGYTYKSKILRHPQVVVYSKLED